MLSPLDAHYSFMMLKFLHNNGTPGFRTLHILDRLLRKNQLVAIMFECTNREAENFGRFLNEVLKDLSLWHADRNTYEKAAFGAKRQLPGFAKRTAKGEPDAFLEYEDFRRILSKWHSAINNALKQCFEAKEYMQIQNAMKVLQAIHLHFPIVNFMGTQLVEKLKGLHESESREDLKLTALSLMTNVKRREGSWMILQAFRNVSVRHI